MEYFTSLPLEYQALMNAPNVETPNRCAVCGRFLPYRVECETGPALERHHMVFRSMGRVFDDSGNEIPKPTITLCGMGNNLRDADGRILCHGAAHHRLLHFYWNTETEQLEYLFTPYPTKYHRALDLTGWRPVGGRVASHMRRGVLATRYDNGAADIPY